MDIRSSVIFVVIIGLWLVWVAPYVLRFQAGAGLAEAAAGRRLSMDSASVGGPTAGLQGMIMENTVRSAPSGQAAPATTAAGSAAFRIRWGRTVLALVGTMAAAAFVTGTLLALFGALPGRVPFIAFLIAAAVVVTLRSLAVRDRARRAHARREQPHRTRAVVEQPAEPVRRRETVLFNGAAEAEEASRAAAQPAPLSAEQLRAEALKVAAEAARKAAAAPGAAWQPVELPKPTYVAAAKAERPAPEPLPAPEVKKPATKVNIKQDAALKASAAAEAAAASAAAPAPAPADPAAPATAAAAPATSPAAAATDSQAASSRPQTGKLNLDAVLQRRRA